MARFTGGCKYLIRVPSLEGGGGGGTATGGSLTCSKYRPWREEEAVRVSGGLRLDCLHQSGRICFGTEGSKIIYFDKFIYIYNIYIHKTGNVKNVLSP